MTKAKKIGALFLLFATITSVLLVASSCSRDRKKVNSGDKLETTYQAATSADLSQYVSINGICILDGKLFASDETKKCIYKISPSGDILAQYNSKNELNNVVSDGKNIYALEGSLNGALVKLNQSLEVISSVNVGHTPSDMAVLNGKGYIANRFSSTVSVVTLDDMKISETLNIDGREPIAVAATATDVYVACHLPDEDMTSDVISANVIHISSDHTMTTLSLVNGSSGVKDICVSPDGKYLYASHIVGRYAYPTTQLDRAWINSNCVSVIDASSSSVVCTVLLDEVDLGAANPYGLCVSSDGKFLSVALSGTNEVMIIELKKMHSAIDAVKYGASKVVSSTELIVDYLPFLNGARKRVPVGTGARAVFEDNGVLYCASYFDATISCISLSDLSVSTILPFEQPQPNEIRQGHILFSDANSCYQKWQSCNSCHPDARIDGFNWDNLNDGIGGGGKSARSMLYTHRTPPVMSTGIRANAEIAVAAGMKFIQFNTLKEEQLVLIDEYLKSLTPVQSPYLNTDGTLTESAKNGKKLFENNCASCHPAPLYTDNKLHDVGTNSFSGDSGEFDVPTLVEVWRSAPYMHDGTYNTIESVVRHFAPELSEGEVKNLSDYVKSIGNENEVFGVEQVRFTDSDGGSFYNVYREGACAKEIFIRRQLPSQHDEITVCFEVISEDGNQLFFADTAISLESGSAKIIIEDECTLPKNGAYRISIYDKKTGDSVTTPFYAN